jgi:hypothetical protein
VEPGEFYLLYFPFSYLEEEPYKRRPVLVVGCTMPGEKGDHAVLVAQVTSSPQRVMTPGPGDVLVPRWRESGLRRPSVVRSRRLWTPEPRDFAGDPSGRVEPLGRIEKDALEEVLSQVRLLISSQGA